MPATRYAIACTGRQGSTYLERILDQHPQIACAGEIFSDFAFKGHGREAVTGQLQAKVLSSPKPIVGFKLSSGDVMRHPELVDVVTSDGYRIIHLTRANLLDQYISGQLAMANGAFTSDFPGKGISSFRQSAEEIRAGLSWLAFGDLAMAALLAGLPTMALTYEELIRPETLARVYAFLGATPMDIQPRTEKQRTGGQRAALENYDEVKEALASTRWARYFVE